MSKNLLKALGLGVLMTSALVAGDCSVKSGAYAGISAGVSHLGGKSNYRISSRGSADVFASNYKTSANSFLAGLFAGYGYRMNSLWAAGELFYNFDNFKSDFKTKFGTNADNRQKSFNIKSSGAWGANLHVGFLANQGTIVYLIAGLEMRKFKVKFSDPVVGDFSTLGLRKGYTSLAFVPGVGTRMNIAKNLAMRLEYKCAMHKNKKLSSSSSNTGHYGAGDPATLVMKNKPMIHSFNVGVAYAF
jgi:opacity protein-like surface antigen